MWFSDDCPVDANIDEDELESLIENHETSSLFVGNVS